MDPGSGEYYKLKLWVDTFMSIPFGKYHKLPVTINSGKEICNKFMENAKNVLDQSVYGLEDAKMQIMQVLGQLITNPNSIGTAIAIKGPPGTGKTTLIKEGVSKILDRPFAFLALGGATDSSFLEGHSYTYEGSVWGKVVDILIQAKRIGALWCGQHCRCTKADGGKRHVAGIEPNRIVTACSRPSPVPLCYVPPENIRKPTLRVRDAARKTLCPPQSSSIQL